MQSAFKWEKSNNEGEGEGACKCVITKIPVEGRVDSTKALLGGERARDVARVQELQAKDKGNGKEGQVREALNSTKEAKGPIREARASFNFGEGRPGDDGEDGQVAHAFEGAERAAGARRQAAASGFECEQGPSHYGIGH